MGSLRIHKTLCTNSSYVSLFVKLTDKDCDKCNVKVCPSYGDKFSPAYTITYL